MICPLGKSMIFTKRKQERIELVVARPARCWRVQGRRRGLGPSAEAGDLVVRSGYVHTPTLKNIAPNKTCAMFIRDGCQLQIIFSCEFLYRDFDQF